MPSHLSLFSLAVVLSLATACGQTKTREIKSGRLTYVETLRYGAVGTHGNKGWYVGNRQFQVNGKNWSPPGINVNDDVAGIEASPNASVEALRCISFAAMKETTYVLRMDGDRPVWQTACDAPYKNGENLGQWTGDGRWLLFADHYFNVETSERREVRGLPDSPDRYFLAASPDLATILYQEGQYRSKYDPRTREVVHDEEADKRWEMISEHSKKGVTGLWLIEAKTGRMKMLELDKSEYPWAVQDHNDSRADWLKTFQSKLRWEKDLDGRDRLVYPK